MFPHQSTAGPHTSRARRATPRLALILLLAAFLRFYRLDSVPPGLFIDEAWATVRARDLLSAANPPVYFAANFGGIHPAVVYLTALARWLAGGELLAIRYAVAAAGVIAVALTFFALRAILQTDEESQESATNTALAGAIILAITFPFLVLSRIGFETILPAIPACLTFYFLARALRAARPAPWFVWAGMALGLSLYTYYSARFLPVAVAVALLWVGWATGRWRRSLAGLGLTAFFAGVVFLPLAVYFLQHWEQFIGRAGVASHNTLGPGAASVPLALLANLLNTLAGFSLPGSGDQLMRHNLPGRPVYDPILSLLFWLGLLALARRPRQIPSALLLSWAGVMLLPTILTDGAPTFTRLLGAMPALAGIAAAGARTLFRLLSRPRLPARLAPAVLAAGLTASLAVTVVDYFGHWAHDPRLHEAFEVGKWQAATLAQERVTRGPLYAIPDLLGPSWPTFDLFLQDSGAKNVGAPTCLAYFDRPARPVTYLVDTLRAPETLPVLQALFPAHWPVETIIHPPTGATLYALLTAPAGAEAAPPPLQPSQAAFGPFSLAGYAVEPARPRPGDTLTVRLLWQARSRPPDDVTIFLHLYPPGEEEREPLVQSDQMPCAGAYPTSRWDAGEFILDEHTLILPADYAAPSAVLGLGAYTWPTFARLPLEADPAHVLSGDRLRLASLATGQP